jgi:hypothetical protein
MRTALLTVTALVALSSLAIAQDIAATAPKEKPINPNAEKVRATPGSRLHYDLPCRVSSVGTCITEPQYRPYRPKP